jgi:hypothetical protein
MNARKTLIIALVALISIGAGYALTGLGNGGAAATDDTPSAQDLVAVSPDGTTWLAMAGDGDGYGYGEDARYEDDDHDDDRDEGRGDRGHDDHGEDDDHGRRDDD